MKLFNAIATTVVISGSLFTTSVPANAQYYGNGYGYNNGVKNGYGPAPTRSTSYTPSSGYTFPRNYQPGLDRNLRYEPGSCSTYINC